MPAKKLTGMLVTSAVLLSGAVFAAEKEADRGRALLETKCSVCHVIGRPLGMRKDRDGWTQTVTRMRKVNGCNLTEEEAKQIVDYLVRVRGPENKNK